jgi:hypothetical protein
MGKVEPIHHSILAQQVGELSNVRRNASTSPLIAALPLPRNALLGASLIEL